jgi:hypothetical protein
MIKFSSFYCLIIGCILLSSCGTLDKIFPPKKVTVRKGQLLYRVYDGSDTTTLSNVVQVFQVSKPTKGNFSLGDSDASFDVDTTKNDKSEKVKNENKKDSFDSTAIVNTNFVIKGSAFSSGLSYTDKLSKAKQGGKVFYWSGSTSAIDSALIMSFNKATKHLTKEEEAEDKKMKNEFYTSTFQNSNSFKYKQWSPYFQALSIPIKFRNATAGVQPQVETGVSVAFAPGVKHSWVNFKGDKNAFGKNTSQFSIAAGLFIGVGATSIDKNTTNNRVLEEDKSKNAIIPYGFSLVFGWDMVNIGWAIGKDKITGPNKEDWIYKGKWWNGVVVGIDLYK